MGMSNMGSESASGSSGPGKFRLTGWVTLMLAAAACTLPACASRKADKQNTSFFTSGSKEADQRASQRMAKAEQLSGGSEGSAEKGTKKAGGSASSGAAAPGAAEATQKTALYTRLGGEVGISNIVNDVLPRLLQDPRINWDRSGAKRGGLFHHSQPTTWKATPQNVAVLKKHLVEFLALASGGPAHYTGKEIKPLHAGMQISNPEFDAAVGDVKASLDRMKVPNTEQKEFLAIIESTRPQIVEQR
jgi:hemoglobin